MLNKLFRTIRNEKGITGLETAIILIAFVVVASVFAYTVLSAGIFSAEKGKETIYAGLKEAAGSMTLKGAVIATDNDTDNNLNDVIFMVTNAVGGEPIDLTAPTDSGDGTPTAGSTHKMIVSYTDKNQRVEDIVWSKTLEAYGDSDDLLEPGEVMQITVTLAAIDGGANPLGADTQFTLELKPPKGSALVITRTTPGYIDPVNDLR
ncbi:MAG: hypothetical protein HY665_07735 [Chloroflexi bacterium]|nr:hypothetical protein [Chloroflexota bacterium]